MTFRNSFYISIAMHIVIFGSAVAFAQYAAGMFISFPHATAVSLVSLGNGGGHSSASPVRNGLRSNNTVHQSLVQPAKSLAEAQPEGPEAQHALSGATAPGIAVSGGGDGNSGEGPTTALAHAGLVGPGPNASGSSQWAVIGAAIERTKSYPRIARERGIEGVVRLRFRMRTSGSVDKIEIVESSGSDVLDSASVQAVHRAEPLPYVQGWVEVPISYVLK